ncbi:MAG: DUF983 domain-containing protein [Bacteroidota bacterium]
MGLLKGTKVYSIFTGTCPVCHTGKMYQNRNAYKTSETLKMHERCPHCNTKFKIEPSFFYGAMYVSYPVGLIFAGISFAITFLWLDLGKLVTLGVIAVLMVLLLPVILRLSRNIWINFFFKFDKSKV